MNYSRYHRDTVAQVMNTAPNLAHVTLKPPNTTRVINTAISPQFYKRAGNVAILIINTAGNLI